MATGVETHIIKNVQFGIFSEQDILKMAVCEVTSPLIYNKDTNLPNENGILDPKMGVSVKGLVCQTCFKDIKECPGHFGYIKLAETVFHLEFIEIIQKILQSVCYNCSKLLVPNDSILSILAVKNKRKRLQEIKIHRKNRCEEDPNGRGCGKYQPIYRKKNKEIYVEMRELKSETIDHNEDDLKQLMRASEVYDIFRKIDDDTVKILGLSTEFSRPENLLIKLLIVAPPAVRPSIELSSSARSEDDLTHHYQTILSTNLELKKALDAGANRARLDELTHRLQDLVGYLINNDKNIAKQKGGRPIKSISQRLKGKEGRLRGNLMGKRVDFSSRTVVSPDPSLDLDQLGVPFEIAKELTIPETVTQLNIEFLRQLVERGDEWPGARYYISKLHNYEIIDLMYVKHKPNLQYGDIVERHLIDGDYVVFNRQPSLHKMSIMGHRVKVMPFLSFRLNLAVTTPYNADFDGDEMNMHVPQNLESKSEVKHIMHIPKQIITPQSNRPVMGLNQDVLMGIRLFTFRDNFMGRSHLFDIIMHIDDWNGVIPMPAILKPARMWSGKQIISMILPPKVDYERSCDGDVREELYESDDAIIVNRGELMTGVFRKKIVGNTPNSIISCIWIAFGPDKTKDFMTYAQKIVNCWLLKQGFTVGIEDTIVPTDVLKEINKEKQKVKKKFNDILEDAQKENKLLVAHQPGKTIIQSFEYSVNSILNDCRKDIGSMLNTYMSSNNNIKHMIISGSKGNDLNISQICGIVGQQNVEGQRIPFGFHRRTLPHFLKDDFGPESRGFVANSYYKGLNPEEFFFHTMGGREGLIDTAVKTSQTGYMQRRLVKALEDVMVQYDSTVRDSFGNIIEYVYGDDGVAGEFIEAQRFDIVEMSDEMVKKRCCFFEIDEQKPDLGFEDSINKYYDEGLISVEVRDKLLKNKEAHTALYEEYLDLLKMRDQLRIYIPAADENIKLMPVNLERIIQQTLYQKSSNNPSDLSPLDVIIKLRNLCNSLKVLHKENNQNSCAAFSKKMNDNATFIFRSNIMLRLCSHRAVLNLRLSRNNFDYLIEEVLSCYNQAKAQPGEMIGSIAAQSIGETLTQMTLNTFHFAGVSSQNITLGVPRIQEIINCSHNIKGASMLIFLKEEYRFSPQAVQKLISILEYTTVSQIAISSEVYFDPDLEKTVVLEDQNLIFMEEEEYPNSSPWVLRITIDPILLARRGIKFKEILQKIDDKINKSLPIKLHIIDSLETANPIILRIRIISGQKEFNDIRKLEQYILEDLPLKGFCKKVSYRTDKVKIYSDRGKVQLSQQEFVLETSGTDLNRVLRLPMIDKYRTRTNHIWDIYKNLGIEATRLAIINEIRFVFRFFSIYVNYRHINLLADCITNTGRLMSISRTGINRVYQSPLRKSSFEETVDILLEAAIYADNDKLKGVTENVMFGQLSKIGTGCFSILMDENYLIPKPEDSEKSFLKWRFVPEKEQMLDVEVDFDDEHYQKYMQTPILTLNTPNPSDLRNNSRGRSYEIGPNTLFTPMMTPQLSTSRGMAPSNMIRSPANTGLYSPFHRPQPINSPMIENPQYSPRFIAAANSVNVNQNTAELRFSPSSPHYNPSPNRINSPGLPRLTAVSPSYSHNSSSPYYSPNSVSPGGQSLLRMGESPAINPVNENFYEPHQKTDIYVKKEKPEDFSEEEG